MNRKGFAISTLIYGLAIMGIMLIAIIMQFVSSTRSNSKLMAEQVEKDLNRYSKTAVKYAYKNELQRFEVPAGASGWYRIQLWGAGHAVGSKGAYTTGVIYLEEGETLYINTGKKGVTGVGGGATDVRLINGVDSAALASRIMVAAGAGSTVSADGGTICGYGTALRTTGGTFVATGSNRYKPTTNLLGTFATGYPKNPSNCVVPNANNGTETAGGDGYYKSTYNAYGGASYISGYIGSKTILDGVMTDNPTYTHREYLFDESGQGYYSDDEGKDYYFLDGLMVPGANAGDGKAIIERELEAEVNTGYLPNRNVKFNKIVSIIDCIPTTDIPAGTEAWQKIQAMSRGKLVEGTLVDVSQDEKDATGIEGLDNFKCKKLVFTKAIEEEVVDCSEENAELEECKEFVEDEEIYPVEEGCEEGEEDCIFVPECEGEECIDEEEIIDDGGEGGDDNPIIDNPIEDEPIIPVSTDENIPLNLDEVYILHTPGKDYKGHYLIFKALNPETNTYQYNNIVMTKTISESETINGTRFSAYQPDNINETFSENNTCIFFSVLSENRVISAQEDIALINEPISADLYNGDGTQKWNIQKLKGNIAVAGQNEFSISEVKRFKALTIQFDENKEFNKLIANTAFNINRRNEPQIWTLRSHGDGTYFVNTIVASLFDSNVTGSLVQYTPDASNKIAIAPMGSSVARYKLYCLQYNNRE